jgi:DNA-binding MarR family transcriptional regulator
MSARETAELLLLVGRLVQAEGYDGELSPAQWMALRYFARANPFSRTPSAFAAFQATTRGTASQAIRALERQVGTWSDSDPKRMGEASVCD